MKRNIILFDAFLSAFILILIPSIGCVNANIQNENNLNTKNINIDDIKKIRDRLKDSDCNCQKTTDNINGKSQEPRFICGILFGLVVFIGLLMNITFNLFTISHIFLVLAWGVVILASILNCEWVSPLSLNNVFINNEHFLYNFLKFFYFGLGDLYEM